MAVLEILSLLGYAIITAIVGAISAAVVYARWHYGTLEKIKGLPAVVKPAFVGGSDVFIHKKVVHLQDMENVQKYGKIYGYYEGRAPHIYIADAELIRLIFIKDFNEHFQNKRILDFGHEYINDMMDILPYNKWKVVRNFLSPTLTTGKLRHMSVSMLDSINGWIETVKEKLKNEEPFEPKTLYTALTADVIARCGFGTKLNSLHDPDDPFVKHMKALVLDDEEPNLFLPLGHIFPFMMRLAPLFAPGTMEFFGGVLKNVMRTRRENNIKVHDIVDSLNEMMEKLPSEEYRKLGITETTVICQAILFFMAGFETTASTMTYLSYHLAKDQEVQEKLIAEVDAYLGRHDGKIEHETIYEMTYLTACIQETVRMYPPLIRVERVCNKDWYHEPTGLHIPKGVVVQVPIHAVHFNPEYFPEPYNFKPERFLNKDEQNQYAFVGFGMGPHNCIGMRFAKEEMMLAMTSVLKNFKFRPNADSKIRFKPGRTFLMLGETFTLDAIKRA